MRTMRTTALVLAALLALACPALADDGPPRLTTPRATLSERDGALLLGVPGGRAWGIESALRRAPRHPALLTVPLAVDDAAVREAFVRVAWYARASGRQRQLEVHDSAYVTAGERLVLEVPLDPPDGATAYRVRVLVRLVPGVPRSSADAVVVGPALVRAGAPRLATRLLWDPPR